MTSISRAMLIAAACAAVAAPAVAQAPLPIYVVPVIAKVKGTGTSDWRTNLSISNVSDSDVNLSAHFFKEKQTNTFNGTFAKTGVVVKKGETLLVTDVLGTWFPSAGSSTKGWMLLAETSPQICPEPDDPPVYKLAVNARIYNAANPQALYGQTIEALWTTVNPTNMASIITGILNQGAAAKPGSRTNVGVANISTVAISVRIKLFRANGTVAGEVTRTVEALSLRQWSLDTELGFPLLDGKAGRLEVALVDPDFDPCADVDDPPLPGCDDPCAAECTPAVRWQMPTVKLFFAYASNVDNGSGDGENLLPVIDYLAYSDYVDDYREQHCPDNGGSSLAQILLQRYGLDRVKPQATFRKLPSVTK